MRARLGTEQSRRSNTEHDSAQPRPADLSKDETTSTDSTDVKPQRNRKSVAYWLLLLVKSFVIALVVVAVSTYIFFTPRLFGHTFGHIILMPYPPDESYDLKGLRGIEKQDVYFNTADGAKLHGWFYRKPDSKYVAMVTHGNAGHIGGRLLLADVLLDAGVSVLMYDYRGYGKSKGEPKLQKLVTDADTAFTYLVNEQHYKPADIILVGESIGCGVTSDLLKMHPDVPGVMLVSPFTSLSRLARSKVPYFCIYPEFLDFDPPLDNMAMVRQKHPPLLITHGDADNLVPFSESETLFAAAAEPKQFMPLKGCGHNDYIKDHEFFKRGLLQFLQTIETSRKQPS